MNQTPTASSLLSRVQRRLTVVNFARTLHRSLLATVGLGCLAVLIVRLFGLLPPGQQYPEYFLIGIPTVAAAFTWLLTRRPATTQAAANGRSARSNR
jgi:hypothetical protein